MANARMKTEAERLGKNKFVERRKRKKS